MNHPNPPILSTEEPIEPARTDIHECMVTACSENATRPAAMINFSVRMPKATKDLCMFICERNATDLGSFLRSCAVALAKDYGAKLPDQE
jgi:hypothetical protein